MSIFAGITKESATRSGRYIQPGRHILTVREIKLFESSQKKGRWFFCVEADVDEYVPEVESPTYSTGSVVSWLVNMEQPSALGNVKGFAMALLPDTPEEDLDETAMEQLVGPEQPAAGIRVVADAVNIKTRAGNDFTKVNWSPATVSE
jgi:hypothetical protein